MNKHKNKCFTQGSHLSEPKFSKIWQNFALTLPIGQNSIVKLVEDDVPPGCAHCVPKSIKFMKGFHFHLNKIRNLS